MWWPRPKLSIAVTVLVFILAAASFSSATQKRVAHKQPVPETTVEVVPPPPPPRPEQMPAVAPQVSYQNGMLTIIARNSTLGDILRAVHTKTGASIELAGSAPERVVGQFGPGPSRDVMTSLLNGSHFNYVMLGSEAHPEQLERLILTAKAGGDAPPPSGPAQPVQIQQVQNEPVPIQPQADAQDPNASDDFTDDASTDADQVDQQADDQQGQQIGQPNVKTPEQLLLEMQRQQQLQQQQQQQQQQGGAPVPGQGFPPGQPGLPPQAPPH